MTSRLCRGDATSRPGVTGERLVLLPFGMGCPSIQVCRRARETCASLGPDCRSHLPQSGDPGGPPGRVWYGSRHSPLSRKRRKSTRRRPDPVWNQPSNPGAPPRRKSLTGSPAQETPEPPRGVNYPPAQRTQHPPEGTPSHAFQGQLPPRIARPGTPQSYFLINPCGNFSLTSSMGWHPLLRIVKPQFLASHYY